MTLTPEQALEQAALAGIHRLRIPTPFAVGRVNCYLLEDEPLTLIDTGPNSGKALDELQSQLDERGHSIADLELIVVTHQHIDHLGLVEIAVQRSGAEVAALGVAAERLANFDEDAEAEDRFAVELMLRNGIPEEVTVALRSVSRSGYELVQAIWGNVAVTQAFLTLSEVIGHADLLVNEGRVREADDGEVIRYETTQQASLRRGNGCPRAAP